VNDKGKPHGTYAIDAGLALSSLLLQAHLLGLVAHPMAGFDATRAHAAIGAPADVVALVMVALGHPGDPALLPEHQRAREAPNARKPQSEWTFRDRFPPA
jgi:nitroreductase